MIDRKLWTPIAIAMFVTLGCSSKPQPATPEQTSFLNSTQTDSGKSPDLKSEGVPNVTPPGDASPNTNSANLKKNEKYGYSVPLPEGWRSIEAEDLARVSEAVSKPNLKIEYVDGYQRADHEAFDNPLILVCRLPESVMPKNQIAAAQNLFKNSGDKIAELIEQKSGIALHAKIGVPVLETESGIVWLKAVSGQGTEEDPKIELLIAHHYSNGFIYQFNAAVLESRSKEDWPVIETMLRGINVSN